MKPWLTLLIALGAVLSPLAAAQSDATCEAITLFYEASTEPLKGKRAVLDVIRHRASALGKTSCEVVKQRGQFSFVHKKFKWKITQGMLTTWQNVDIMSPVCESCWYFNSGKRIKKYKFSKRIKNHNFYLRK